MNTLESISAISKDINNLQEYSQSIMDKDIVYNVFDMFANEINSCLSKCKSDLEIVAKYNELTKKCSEYNSIKLSSEVVAVENKAIKVKRISKEKAKIEESTIIEDQPIKAKRPYIRKKPIQSKVAKSKDVAVNEPVFKEEKTSTNATIKLENIDSLVGMQSLPDACVDLVLTDPPYGIASKNKLTMVNQKVVSTMEAWGNDFKDDWKTVDEYWEWFKPFVAQMVRVMKDGASMILFLDRKYIGLITYYLETQFNLKFKNNLYFSKGNPTPSIYKNQYRSNMETAIWLCKGNAKTFNFSNQKDMIQTFYGNIGKKFYLDGVSHPTEKYSWMIEPLISNHSKEGQTVLDCFAGSGTTLIHAKRKNRNAIGFELNEKFYKIAKARKENDEINTRLVA